MPICSVCGNSNRGVFSCDECAGLFCDTCSGLTSSEIRCLELKKRSLLFHCKSCLSNAKHDSDGRLEEIFRLKMEEALKVLNTAFESFKADFLSMASGKLATLAVAARSPVSETTYASVASSSSQRSVIVRPKDSSQKNSKTKLDLVAGVDPVGSNIKINTVKHIKNGGIVVGCDGAEDAGRFVRLAEEKLSSGYDVHILKKILPRIRITGLSENFSPDTLKEYIVKQNDNLIHAENCRVLTVSAIKNNSRVFQATLQLDTISYGKVLKAGSLIVGFDVCRVYDAVELTRCYKCNGFNHTSKSCKKSVVCPRCAAGHEVKSCTVSDAGLCCVNCAHANEKYKKSFDTKHAVWNSQECSVYKEMILKFKSDLFGTK